MASAVKPKAKQEKRDEVDTNSNDSFPASDAPSWTPVRRIGQPRVKEENSEPS